MRDIISEFLIGLHTMSLATSRDNSPYAASLFYASDGLTVYFISEQGSEHSLIYARAIEKLYRNKPLTPTPIFLRSDTMS